MTSATVVLGSLVEIDLETANTVELSLATVRETKIAAECSYPAVHTRTAVH